MRTFNDANGASWQTALLHGSYGNIALIFSPLAAGDVRQLSLQSENLAEAEAYLASLDAEGLRQLLAEATPWGPVGGEI